MFNFEPSEHAQGCPGMPRDAQACPVGTNCPGNMACGYRPHFWEQDAHFWTQEPLLGGFSVVIAKLAIYIAKIAKLAQLAVARSPNWRKKSMSQNAQNGLIRREM